MLKYQYMNAFCCYQNQHKILYKIYTSSTSVPNNICHLVKCDKQIYGQTEVEMISTCMPANAGCVAPKDRRER